jgi:cellulose biosynthesis protein BcsQ
VKVLATYSIKGGVGKTSAAVNLAGCAADRGWRVLLWDLDPQGAATYLLRVRPRVRGGGKALVTRRRSLQEVARATDIPNLDLVPSDFRYRHLDLLLDAIKRPTRRLRTIVKPVADEYDFVILDCAPSVSLVSEGVLGVADALLVPVIPSTLSVRTVDQLTEFIRKTDVSAPRPEIIAFFSMVDGRKRLHRDIVNELPAQRPGMIASTSIPNAAVVERMGVERAALNQFAATSQASRAYDELWAEIEARWPEP